MIIVVEKGQDFNFEFDELTIFSQFYKSFFM